MLLRGGKSTRILHDENKTLIYPYHILYNEFLKNNSMKKITYISYMYYNNKKLNNNITINELISMIHSYNNNITILISPIHPFNYLFDNHIIWSNTTIEFVKIKNEYAVKYTIPRISWEIKDKFKIDNMNNISRKTNGTSYCFLNNIKYVYKKTIKPLDKLTYEYLQIKDKPKNFIKLEHTISKTEHIYNYLGYTTNDITQEYIENYVVQILNIFMILKNMGFCRTDNKPKNFTYIYHINKCVINIKEYKIQSHYEWCLIDVDNIYNYTPEIYETSKIMFILKCLIKMNNKYINNKLLPEFLIYMYEKAKYNGIEEIKLYSRFNKNLLKGDDKMNKYYIYERYTVEVLNCCFIFIERYKDFNKIINEFNIMHNNDFIYNIISYPNKDIVDMIRIILNNNVDKSIDLLL